MTAPKIDRNKELYSDYKSGKYSIVDLVAKYRISSSYIYDIISRMKPLEDHADELEKELNNFEEVSK